MDWRWIMSMGILVTMSIVCADQGLDNTEQDSDGTPLGHLMAKTAFARRTRQAILEVKERDLNALIYKEKYLAVLYQDDSKVHRSRQDCHGCFVDYLLDNFRRVSKHSMIWSLSRPTLTSSRSPGEGFMFSLKMTAPRQKPAVRLSFTKTVSRQFTPENRIAKRQF